MKMINKIAIKMAMERRFIQMMSLEENSGNLLFTNIPSTSGMPRIQNMVINT